MKRNELQVILQLRQLVNKLEKQVVLCAGHVIDNLG